MIDGIGFDDRAKQKRPVRGSYVRSGDRISLRSCLNGEYLALKRLASGGSEVSGLLSSQLVTSPEGQMSNEAFSWEIRIAGIIFLPNWATNRPYLTGKFIFDSGRGNNFHHASNVFKVSSNKKHSLSDFNSESDMSKSSLATMPTIIQEQVLLEDLISVFMGLDGTFVRKLPSDSPKSLITDIIPESFYVVADGADASVNQLLQRMLPAGALVVKVKAFCLSQSRHEFGMVSQALCAGLMILLKEFTVLVAQVTINKHTCAHTQCLFSPYS